MSEPLGNLYASVAARAADSVIGWRHGSALRNAEFLQRIAAWHGLLQHRAGKNYALYLDDSIEFGAALIGAWQARKTVWLTADALSASIESLKDSVDGFLGDFPSECAPLVPGTDDVKIPPVDAATISGNFAAMVVHTSGTTGAAQAIPKRLAQLSSEVATLERAFGRAIGDADIIATVSHQHIYGLLFRILWPLTAGRAIHAQSQNFPEELAEALALRSCVLIASPAHLKRLPDHLDWRGASTCVRAVFSSGGPLPLDVAQATAKLLGQAPIEVYGSSETGGIAWRQRSASADESWLPFPQVEWRIADGDGESSLEVRSPNLADANWLRLADRVQAHGTDRFLLNGRGDRIVKIEEKRISLDAIEALLAASPLVAAARVVLCDEAPGQRQQLAAFVVASEQGQQRLSTAGKLALNRELRALLIGQVEPVAYPRRWRYLEQMPFDAQGKTTRALLLALLDTRPREPQWRILESEASKLKLEVTVPVDLFYFDGHFPCAPILPGVVQLDWAIAIGRRHFVLPLHFSGVSALKFQHVIQPGNVLTLELTHDVDKGNLNFRYVSPLGQHASGRIHFCAAYSQPHNQKNNFKNKSPEC
jgi:acyl-CoA synthetase (AMP-forming)/AMP-acid ligase II